MSNERARRKAEMLRADRDEAPGHTPGPWTEVGGFIMAPSGDYISDPHMNGGPMDHAERDANAALIAAAPDLLAALRDLANQATYYAEKFALNIPSIGAARAAIARAEGAPK